MYLDEWKIKIAINEAQHQLQQSIALEQTTNAVSISESDSASVQETLYLLSVPGMRESIREGLATPIEHCDRPLEW